MLLDLLRLVQLKQNMELYAEQQQVSFHLQAHQHNNNNNNNNNNHHHHHHHHQAATSGQKLINFDRIQMPTSNHRSHNQARSDKQQIVREQQEASNFLFNHKQNHHHHHHHRFQVCQLPQTPQAQATSNQQCKPLDLSVKNSKQLFASGTAAAAKQLLNQSNICHQQHKHKQQFNIRPMTPINLSPDLHRSSQSNDDISQVHNNDEFKCSIIQSSTRPNNEIITSSTSPSSISNSASSSMSSADSRCHEVISPVTTNSGPCSSIFPETNDIHPIAKITQKKTTTKTTTNSNKSTSINLRRQKHKGAKSHLCLQCGRSFSRSDMLTRHSRLHSGLKPYQCGKCKQVFSRSDHLSTHERTHTGEKPYQCQFCAYSACRRDMITRHMRTHSGGGGTTAGQRNKTQT